MNKAEGKTILLIEDDQMIRELYRQIFEFSGYRVIEAIDGNDGVDKFIEHQEDVGILVADVLMPNKNGLEAYNQMKNIKSDLKVIFTSGHNTDLNKTLQAEGFNYMQKPFSPEDLLRRVREVLDDK